MEFRCFTRLQYTSVHISLSNCLSECVEDFVQAIKMEIIAASSFLYFVLLGDHIQIDFRVYAVVRIQLRYRVMGRNSSDYGSIACVQIRCRPYSIMDCVRVEFAFTQDSHRLRYAFV